MNNKDIELSTHEQKFAFIALSNQNPIAEGDSKLIDRNYARTLQEITKLSAKSPITAALIRESVKTVTEERGLSGVEKNTIEIKLLSHLAVIDNKFKVQPEINVSTVSNVITELQTGISGSSHA